MNDPKPWIYDEHFLKQLLGNLPGFVSVNDETGRYRFINRVDPGMKQADIIGKPIFDFVNVLQRKEFKRAFRAALGGRATTVRASSAHDSSDWFENTLSPLRWNGRAFVVSTAHRSVHGDPRFDDREFLRSILDSLPGYVAVHDRRGRCLFVNRTLRGMSMSDVLGRPLSDFVPPPYHNMVLAAFEKVFKMGKIVSVRTAGTGDNGPAWYEATIGPLRNKGRIVAAVSFSYDISERIRLEQTEADLKRLRERFELVFNHASDGMTITTLDGTLLNANPAFCRLLGYTRSELINKKKFLEVTAPEFRAMNKKKMSAMLTSGRALEFEKAYIRKDGGRVPVLVTTFVLKDAAGKPTGYSAIVRDLTERRRSQALMDEVAAREQSRLGRDLHDGIGQYLTGIALMARSLQARMATLGFHAESREAARISVAANAAVAQTRALAQGLIPTELNDGLTGALAALASSSRALFGTMVSVSCPERLALRDPKIAVNLYRIAQEAVHNACRHGKARKISIRVDAGARGAVTLRVTDDGAGLPARVRPGMGMRTMTHRAQMLGGSLDISPRSGGGVSVVCRCGGAR